MEIEPRVDRILEKEEIQQLDDLLIPHFSKEYPNFKKWLDDVKKELSEGKRIAIGIWDPHLIATSIIKLTASNVAELKTFFVDPNFEKKGHEKGLYNETEIQCRKAGAQRIISYLYTDDKSMILFLISHGFSISGKEDLYGNSRESYILSKKLNPEYLGDPFDWETMGEWYLQTRLNAIKIEDHPKIGTRNFDRHMRIQLGDINLEALVEIKDQRVDEDPVEILHKKCSESSYHLPIFIAREYSKRAKDYAKQSGVILFSSSDLESILNEKPPIFRSGKIMGMVVSIRPNYLERMIKKNSIQYYVKGGPFGKFLVKGHKLIFYSTDPEKCVKAIGKINSIKIDSPQSIWKVIKGKTIFSENEYFSFAGQKKSILAIEIADISEIPPIRDEELDSIIPKKDRSGSYIDADKLNKILTGKKARKRKAL